MTGRPNPNQRLVRSVDYQQDVSNAASVLTHTLDMLNVLRSCINCRHFREQQEICTGIPPHTARPPARVIAYGCDMHSAEVPY